MGHSRLLQGIVLFLACAAVAVAYEVPQIVHWSEGGRGAVFLSDDEPAYAARVARAMQGHFRIGNPWTYERAADPAPVPPLMEDVVGLAGRALGARTVDAVVIAGRAVLPGLACLAIALAMMELGASFGVSVFVALVSMLEVNPMSYTPLAGWLLHEKGMAYDRFLNPIFPLVTFFLALWAGARAYIDARKHWQRAWRWAALAGVLVGLHFYVSVYYWTLLAAGFALAAVLKTRSPNRYRVLGLGALVAGAVALPYALSQLSLRSHPVFADFAWRNALLIHERPWWSLPNKRLWLLVAVCFSLLRFRRAYPGVPILLAFVSAGLLCFYSSLVTGITLQNYHWHYVLAPMILGGACWGIHLWARRLLSTGLLRLLYCLGGLYLSLVLAQSIETGIASYRELKAKTPHYGVAMGVGLADQAYFGAWEWLREHAPADSVVLAGENTMPAVPARTGLRVWTDTHTTMDLTPFEEMLERNQVLWAIEGIGATELRGWLEFPEGFPVPMWIYGLTSNQRQALVAQGRPAFEAPLRRQLIDAVARDEEALLASPGAVDRVAGIGRKYRVDFVVRGPNEKSWDAERYLRLEKAWEEGGVRIDRVAGWQAPSR